MWGVEGEGVRRREKKLRGERGEENKTESKIVLGS